MVAKVISCLLILSLRHNVIYAQPQTNNNQCLQYYLDTSTTLQCSQYITPCDYVSISSPPGLSLSLSAAEAQLLTVINQAESGVQSNTITRTCFEGFISLYCHQVYRTCTEQASNNDSDGGGYAVSRNGSGVCLSACERVIDGDCGENFWSFLTNIVEQLRQLDIQLPALLRESSQCGVSAGARNVSGDNEMDEEGCTSLETVLPNTDCLPTTSAPTTSTTAATSPTPSVSLIVGISLGVGIPVLLLVLAQVVFILYLLRLQKVNIESEDKVHSTANTKGRVGASNPVTEINPPEFEFQMRRSDTEETMSRRKDVNSADTLMMRQSIARGALLDVNLSPRSNTIARELGTKEFLQKSPKQRLNALEFPHGNICLLKNLWDTNFGKTYLGEASGIKPNELSTTVFIKSLRERASSKLKQQFTIEMTWASGFNHPNIITLLGVCNKEEPRYMIFEHLEYGSLKDFLRSIDSAWFDFDEVLNDNASTCASTAYPVLGLEDFTSIGCQVANGMDYLTKKAFVLKDLAARNCQVAQGLRVKIANFGLNYDLQSKDYCCIRSTKSNPLPLRWLAPESIQHNKFSVYSDIWSFGVLLWEVFTFGERPYTTLSNAQVVQSILSGSHLSKPEKCPKVVYKLMQRCWSKNPTKRPWFSVLSKELKDASRNLDPEELKKIGTAPRTPDLRRL